MFQLHSESVHPVIRYGVQERALTGEQLELSHRRIDMKKLQSIFDRLVTCAVLAGLAFTALLDASFAQNGSTPIGAFVQTSGPDAYAAKAFEQGVQLAIDKKASPALTVKFYDINQGGSIEGTALRSLLEKDRVPLVMYWKTDDIISIAPYLIQSRVIGLVSWEVTKKVSSLGAQIYGFGYSTEASFKELAKYAGNTLKSYRFGLISSSASPFDTQSKAFSEQSKSLGNTIVFDEKVDQADADFKALLTRAQKESCDTLFVTLPSSSLVSFVKAARASAFKGKLIVGDTLFAPELQLLGKDAEGIYMIQAWSDDVSFQSRYSARYGEAPDNVTLGVAALGFDTIECIQGVGSTLDASMIRYSLASKSCEGITGQTRFTGERIAQRRKRVVSVKDGKFTLAE